MIFNNQIIIQSLYLLHSFFQFRFRQEEGGKITAHTSFFRFLLVCVFLTLILILRAVLILSQKGWLGRIPFLLHFLVR